MAGTIKHIAQRDGFTIVELLAAMVISSLVVALVYSMYVFAARLMSGWERRSDLNSIVEECSHTIESDILNSSRVVECNDFSLVLESDQIDTISYTFRKGSVSRNGIPFEAAGQVSQGANPVKLEASVLASVDTSTAPGWPVRLWSISIFGRNGEMRDSSVICLSTPLSSQEILQADSAGLAKD